MAEPEFKKFRLRELNPAAYNPRFISDEALKGLRHSLARWGCVEPIVINVRGGLNVIVGGHQRHSALIELNGGDYECTCVTVDINETDEKLLNLALNNPHIQGDFIENIDKYIELLRSSLPDDTDYLDLQINKLCGEIAADIETSIISAEDARKTLAERFIVPPFSTLDTRQGYWQERKTAWIGLGIRSELGGRDKLKTSGGLSGSVPGYYYKKENTEKKIGRKLNNKEFEDKYLADYRPENSHLAYTETGGILSIFDPVLCEIAYQWFCPVQGRILDPFAGGSVRGIVATWLGHEYTGIDLRAEQVVANQEQAREIGVKKAPEWLAGDSRDVLKSMESGFDFIFSCPPYADLEVYSDDPDDLSNMEYGEFLAAYRDIIAKSVRLLNNNRFACFVVGDIRDKVGFYRNFVCDTIAAFRNAGMELYNEAILITTLGSLPIRVGKQFDSGRKLGKAHQNVLVFYKGDPKAIKQDFGPVEIGDWSSEAA